MKQIAGFGFWRTWDEALCSRCEQAAFRVSNGPLFGWCGCDREPYPWKQDEVYRRSVWVLIRG